MSCAQPTWATQAGRPYQAIAAAKFQPDYFATAPASFAAASVDPSCAASR